MKGKEFKLFVTEEAFNINDIVIAMLKKKKKIVNFLVKRVNFVTPTCSCSLCLVLNVSVTFNMTPTYWDRVCATAS